VEEAGADPAEGGEPKSSTNSLCASALVRFLGLGTPRGVIWDDRFVLSDMGVAI